MFAQNYLENKYFEVINEMSKIFRGFKVGHIVIAIRNTSISQFIKVIDKPVRVNFV